ncbi:hypothetical protein OAF45_00950 [Candidatus Latescibacteria bacterium]|jgi:hypothetical protein|nr:hypothetical protein [Candidatus Latescibacterota bacterium]|tara:strand:+ start:534 stop:680 length:147 start_codon:yes stop_codon:yes gene_type:complete
MHVLIIGGTGMIRTGITRLLVERGSSLYDRIIEAWWVTGDRQAKEFAQ